MPYRYVSPGPPVRRHGQDQRPRSALQSLLPDQMLQDESMTWEEFVVEIVDSLIWPVTLVVGLLIFKDSVKKLLGRASKARLGQAEVDFSNDADRLAHKADHLESSIVPKLPEPDPVGKQSVSKPRDSAYRSTRLIASAREVVDVVPMAAVALGRSALEACLAELLPEPAGGRRRSIQQSIKEASRYLDEGWVQAAREAVALGNAAAHGEAEYVTAEAAANYIDSIENICGFAEMVLGEEFGRPDA